MDGVGDLALDEEGVVVDRNKHTPVHKKLYKKHHKIRGILVAALPRTEYLKMSDKSTAKAMFASVTPSLNYLIYLIVLKVLEYIYMIMWFIK